MKLSLLSLFVGIFIGGVYSDGNPKPSSGCSDPYYAGFKDISGISSLCNNIRPTTTIVRPITAFTTVTTTIILTTYRYTDYTYTRANLTSTRCPTAIALAAPLALSTASSGDLVLSRLVPSATPAALVPRANGKSTACPPIQAGITTGCSCFFPPGPLQTITKSQTVAVETLTTTVTTNTYIYSKRDRTLAEGCAPTQVPIYGYASYAICGAAGLPEKQYQECTVGRPAASPFTYDALDCCSSCANTLDCFQGYVDAASNTCRLDIRLAPDGSNHNRTADCPNDHTFVLFGNQNGVGPGQGFISGHCAQGC